MTLSLTPHDPSEWRRGWPVVLGSTVAMGAGPGLYQNLSSIFVTSMQTQFGWSRGEIATAAALGLAGALAAPLIGRVVDRIGTRLVILLSMAMLATAFLAFTQTNGALWQYQIFVLALSLSAPGFSALVYGDVIAQWFRAHRGFALGIATSGNALVGLVVPSVIGLAMTNYGWRAGYFVLAALPLLVLPVALLTVRPPGKAASDLGVIEPIPAKPGVPARQAWRSAAFWLLSAAIVFITMGSVGLITQLVPLMTDRGMSIASAIAILPAYAAAQIVGRIGVGFLVDRFAPNIVAASVCLTSALGFALLSLQSDLFLLAIVAVFLAGLMNGAEHDLMPFFTARLFGLKAYGEIYGTLFMIALFGTALGIFGFGQIHDLTGGYLVALVTAMVAMVLAAGCMAALGGKRALALD